MEFPSGEQERLICKGSSKENRDRVQCPMFDVPRVQEITAGPTEVLTRDGVLAYEVQWPGEPMPQGTVRAHPLVTVQVVRLTDNQLVDSDAGTRITVRAFPRQADRWAAVWRPELPERIYVNGAPDYGHSTYQDRARRLGCGHLHRFVITGAEERKSSAFRLRCDRKLNEVEVLEGTLQMGSAP